ncbi:MAG: diguanylate cyclase (GGDEF)-like protein [Mariniblastus sp.]|jgi:diguanylate cyclase (GGDEF)-like protein
MRPLAQVERPSIHNPTVSCQNNRPNQWVPNQAVEVTNSPQVLMMDIDFFNQANDLYGYQASDQVLCEFTRRIAPRLDADNILPATVAKNSQS